MSIDSNPGWRIPESSEANIICPFIRQPSRRAPSTDASYKPSGVKTTHSPCVLRNRVATKEARFVSITRMAPSYPPMNNKLPSGCSEFCGLFQVGRVVEKQFATIRVSIASRNRQSFAIGAEGCREGQPPVARIVGNKYPGPSGACPRSCIHNL